MKIQANDPCWCGSGEKYKKCHKEFDLSLINYQKEGFSIIPHKFLKNSTDIEGIRKSGLITRAILDEVKSIIKPGISTEDINTFVHNYTLDNGAIPAPLHYKKFPKSCCTSVNECICHGIPSPKHILKDGDIINVDITSILNGYHSDSSRMYAVGEISESRQKLVDVAKECLMVGLNQVKPFTRLNNIGDAIEEYAKSFNYSVVRDLCGHGIGKQFHEEPEVVHYSQKTKKGLLLIPGMVFTIEPMINEGTYKCKYLNDGWTVLTSDGKMSAQWEHTILVTENGYEILA
ncbi:MAG: type I methionyl aminopeptidase [Bacteroidales bacterium]|nr:type I methionyl aminopeptidase [Bacteroidales bacterium]